MSTEVYLWQAELPLAERSPTGVERIHQQMEALTYLKTRYPGEVSVMFTEQDFWGEWQADSVYSRSFEGEEISYGGYGYYFFEKNNYYDDNKLTSLYPDSVGWHPGWWFIWQDKIVRATEAVVEIATLEAKTEHHFVMSFCNGRGLERWTMTNLPEEAPAQVAPTPPVPLQHPDVSVILAPVYDYISRFSHQRAILGQEGKKKLIGLDGQAITPLEFDRIILFDEQENTLAYKDDQWHLIDLNGQTLSTYSFQDFRRRIDSLMIVLGDNDKVGMIDGTNKRVIPFIFDYISVDEDDQLLIVSYEGYYGLIRYPAYRE